MLTRHSIAVSGTKIATDMALTPVAPLQLLAMARVWWVCQLKELSCTITTTLVLRCRQQMTWRWQHGKNALVGRSDNVLPSNCCLVMLVALVAVALLKLLNVT